MNFSPRPPGFLKSLTRLAKPAIAPFGSSTFTEKNDWNLVRACDQAKN